MYQARLVHGCLLWLFPLLLCFHGVYFFVLFIFGGCGVGKRPLDDCVYSSGPSSLLFYWQHFDKMRGPLLLF
jgi:hypothetical protein